MNRMSRFPSTGQSRFATIPDAQIQRSTFDRSHGYKTTFTGDKLVPCFVDEALPGDTFEIKMNHFVRMTTPIVPFMDNLHFDVFFFAVPNRLLWENWEKFNGAQDSPGDSTDYLIPQVTVPAGGFANSSVADYFGLPTEVDCETVSALPFRAYGLIYREWFRDQNITSLSNPTIETGDGPDDYNSLFYGTLFNRAKRKDYFTSCLPWPQKGDAVEIPIGGFAPLVSTGDGIPIFGTDAGGLGPFTMNLRNTAAGTATTGDATTENITPTPTVSSNGSLYWSDPKLEADLSSATNVTINALRQAFQVQRLFERDARGGTRYIEVIRSHFNVTNPDFRLQRPEYLGGYSHRISVNPIAQTSQTDPAATPQGNLAAVAYSAGGNRVCRQSFTEHCTIIGLMCVRPDLTYQQGIDRMWSRKTRFDFYWPSLAHLGEQAVLSKEIYADGSPEDQDVFGYQERYAEYRYKPSKITGQFRSNFAQSLDLWHLSQEFATRPRLNNSFIRYNSPYERVLAVDDYPEFFGDFWFEFKCTRPMPVYSVPGLIDHF